LSLQTLATPSSNTTFGLSQAKGATVMSGRNDERLPILGFAVWTLESSVVVSVAGEIDIATAPELSEALGAVVCRHPGGIIVDLTDVDFLGAAGLTVLLDARKRATACDTWFDLVCPQALPRRVIALAGLEVALSLQDTVFGAAAAQTLRGSHPIGAARSRRATPRCRPAEDLASLTP